MRRGWLTVAWVATLGVLSAACASEAAPTPTPNALATPTDIWKALLQRTPYPYMTPLPPVVAAAIDGTYVKEEPMIGERIHCRRCPDWGHDGGLWKLRFDKGIFYVLYVEGGWKDVGSYSVSGDRITFFNDPVCWEDVGVYTWKVNKGTLTFQEISDPCFIHLRAENLMWQAWHSCQPPNVEAAITDHWQKPNGCE